MSDLLTRFAQRSDLHQSPMHQTLMHAIGWQTQSRSGAHLFLRHLGPVAIAKIQRPKQIDLSWLNALRKEHHILTLYIEPGLKFKSGETLGFSVEPFAHSCTSLIDLHPSPTSLLASFSPKTRYNITRTLKRGELTLNSTPLEQLTPRERTDFFALRTDWSRRKKIVGYPAPLLESVLTSYQNHGTLHSAYVGNECVGMLLTLIHDAVATYYAAFATPMGYHHCAPTLLTWQAMVNARQNGCNIFDFGGIYDPRYPRMYKKWQGFTKFKSGFRPTVVSYPPTYLKLFW